MIRKWRLFSFSILIFLVAGSVWGRWPLNPEIYGPVTGTTLYAQQGALVRDIPFHAVNELKARVESELKLKLQDRGEAHITIITPPEGGALRKFFTQSEWERMALEELPGLDFEAICVGVGRKGDLVTTFIVVNSEFALNWRRALQKEFIARGGKVQDFDPEIFYPHITLGFTERDLHLQDGVIKNSTSCPTDYYFKIN